jgi:hypothetical protein
MENKSVIQDCKGVECEHLFNTDPITTNGITYTKGCQVATNLAGFHCPALTGSCEFCLTKTDNPKGNNLATRGLVNWRKHELQMESLTEEEKENKFGLEKRIGVGVGTELSKLIPKQLEHKGCGCRDYARKMNKWGVAGCEARRNGIVDHLVFKARSDALLGWVPKFATRKVAEKLLDTAIQRVKKEKENSKFKWCTVVTTAPRPDCTLQRCVDSLFIAGFEPIVFAEPGSTQVKSCQTFTNHERKGVWHNWLQSCKYALNNTDANVIMTVQDDSLFHPDSKTFAESILWPDEETGFVSLYTPKHYSIRPHFKTKQKPVGINRVNTRSLWGACALIWPREVLQQVMDHEFTKKWLGARSRSGNSEVKKKRKKNPHLIQNSDTAIGGIMNRMERKMFFVDPSPVEHIAVHSVIGHGGNKGRRNCMRCAKWSEPLSDQVPVNFEPVDIKI